MAQFMLLIHDGDWSELSPEQMQETINKYIGWSRKLADQGRIVAGDELKEGGRKLVVQDGIVVDGPFAETKELIGGYFIIKAKDYDEAVEITKGCPTFDHGGAVQIREINLREN